VTYKVTELTPHVELEQIALPTGLYFLSHLPASNKISGDKCGSVYIDLAFKNWLRDLIGEKNYEKLDPGSRGRKISSHAAEGADMRKLMKTFDVFKKKFNKEHRDMRMDLPGPLSNLDIAGKVNKGEITITRCVGNENGSQLTI
jgi:hypothetical protein